MSTRPRCMPGRLGARTEVIRWAHAMHPISLAVARAIERGAASSTISRWAVVALARAMAWRIGAAQEPGRHYIPPGGSSPAGILGHVNAGLELAAQIAAGELPAPTHVVLPLGTGGTAAGLALGLGVGGVRTTVIAARVAPRIVANSYRVQSLIRQTRRLLRRRGDANGALPAVPVVVDHSAYAGEYGRPSDAGAIAAGRARAGRQRVRRAAAGARRHLRREGRRGRALPRDISRRRRRPSRVAVGDIRWAGIRRKWRPHGMSASHHPLRGHGRIPAAPYVRAVAD